MSQIRTVMFTDGTPATDTYIADITKELKCETHTVDIMHDYRPCREILPVRTTPGLGVLFFADTLEDKAALVSVLRQLNLFEKQEAVSEIVDELIEAAPEITPALAEKITSTFYGG